MKTYRVIYSGNSTRFKNFKREVNAKSAREAAEKVYKSVLDENYFPQTYVYIVGFFHGNIIGVIDSDGKFNVSDKLDFDSYKFFESPAEARSFIDKQANNLRPGFEYEIYVETGRIKDCEGNIITEPDDDVIDYDGGYFFAEEI